MKIKIYKLIFFISILISFATYAKPHPQSALADFKHKEFPYLWSVGATGIYTFNAYKDTKETLLALPVLSYIGDRVTLKGPYLDYKFIKYPHFELAAELALYPLQFDPKDSSDSKLRKLNKRKYTFLGGINSIIPLQKYGEIQVGLLRSFYGAKDGYFMNSQYKFTLPLFLKNNLLLITPGIGIGWNSKQLNNYYYGISSAEAASSTLTTYSPESSFNPFVSLTLTYILKKRWIIGIYTRYSNLPKTITNSPMVNTKHLNSTAIFITYGF